MSDSIIHCMADAWLVAGVMLTGGDNVVSNDDAVAIRLAAPHAFTSGQLRFVGEPASGEPADDINITDLHAKAVIAAVRECDDVDWLRMVLAEEQAHKARKTVMGTISIRIAALELRPSVDASITVE